MPSPAPIEPARRSPKVASVISEDMSIQGDLLSEGEMHIDGKIIGDVKVARLTLGENGLIEGSVTAEAVEIRGKVVGPVTAKLVRLFASSHIEGDITHEQLAMETGAHFQGRSLKLQRPASGASNAALRRRDAERSLPGPGARGLPRLKSALSGLAGIPRRAHPLGQGRAHEGVQIAVEHARRVGGFDVGAQILDHLIGLQNVGSNLVTPADVGLGVGHGLGRRLALLQFKLV